MDLNFHLHRKTGELLRIMDRGGWGSGAVWQGRAGLGRGRLCRGWAGLYGVWRRGAQAGVVRSTAGQGRGGQGRGLAPCAHTGLPCSVYPPSQLPPAHQHLHPPTTHRTHPPTHPSAHPGHLPAAAGTNSIQTMLSTVMFSIGPAIFDIAASSVYIAISLQPWIAIIVFITLRLVGGMGGEGGRVGGWALVK